MSYTRTCRDWLYHFGCHGFYSGTHLLNCNLFVLLAIGCVCSPGQENQKIFKANFPIESEAIKAKVCDAIVTCKCTGAIRSFVT